jgi:DNA polymerase-3 subunit epsilon/ATP-dependent DNA helicase DinG
VGRTYVALDTEATGLRADTDEIIEIGAVKFRDGQVLDRWESFIRPGQPIPYKVSALTGITWQHVQHAPRLFDVAPALLRFVGDCCIVGHSIEIDLQLLHRQGVRTRNRASDPFELAPLLLPDLPVYNLVGVAAALGVPAPVQHRAQADAVLAMHVFEALVARLGELPLEVLAEINRATATSDWPLRFLFQEVERETARAGGLNSASIRTKLQAAGVSQTELDLGLIHPPPPPEPLEPPTAASAPLDEAALVRALEPGGAIAAAFLGYEHRPQQIEMLRAVTRAFNERRHLLVEADGGTGKSLAYLLPAVQFAIQNQTRVVISTSTANLQDQLYGRDLPALQAALAAATPAADAPADDAWAQALAAAQLGRKRDKGRRGAEVSPATLGPPPPFRSARLKEHASYLCLRRWTSFRKRSPATLDELRMLVKVLIWLPRTTSGDRAELLLINNEATAWARLAVSDEGCPLHECVYNQKGLCFYYRAQRQAEAAHVLVVDHALLLADIASGHTLLPPYRHLIVDEAHRLEEEATEHLGYRVDQEMLFDYLNALSHPLDGTRSAGYLTELRACLDAPAPVPGLGTGVSAPRPRVAPAGLAAVDAAGATIQAACDRARSGAADLFLRLISFLDHHSAEHNEYDKRLRVTSTLRRQPGWSEIELHWDGLKRVWSTALEELAGVLDAIEATETANTPDVADALLEGRTLWRTGFTLFSRLDAALAHPSEGAIYWLAANAREGTLTLHCAPLHVGDLLDRYLFRAKDTVVLTSATLSTEGDFAYVRERLNFHSAQELQISAPSGDHPPVLLYVPEDLPEPNQPGYQRALEQALISLCLAAEGRTLVLFTSHSALRATYKGIVRPLEEAGLLVLGHNLDGSRRQLLERFRRTPRTILLGTASFWDGLDSLGDSLKVLAITKLPFNVPSDPIFAARSEQFDDAFQQYSLPQTILRFKQGFGRLLRRQSERGVVALLDRRVVSKRYGSTFLNSLPPCTVQYGPATDLPAATAEWLGEGQVSE